MTRRAVALGLLLASLIGTLTFVGPTQGIGAPLLFGRMHRTFQPNKGKIFILVIGNDARAGNPNAARADAIHIVGVNTKTMKAGILNFPRDSWVHIPGRGTTKMNEALQVGGPETLGRTLESLTGIHIDYWVMTGFEGFMGIIDGIGGIKVHLSQNINDPTGSGAHLKAGTQVLGPKSSLAYLRTRHSFGSGDLARTTNHGGYLIQMLRKLRKQVKTNPAALLNWISLTKRFTRFDLSGQELFRLGVLASQINPRDVENVTVPARTGSAGAASVVFISSSARSIYRRFRRHASL
jgi:LCP family protein required for cell wall assembly